jgi:hypothetical protein
MAAGFVAAEGIIVGRRDGTCPEKALFRANS